MTETITIAHISDVHLGPIQGFHPRYWNVKRALGYLNWHRGRKFVHDPDVASLIAADALAYKPDHVVVTGDLANLGLPGEYDAALSWLRGLGSPEAVTVVPGNHDIYTARLHGSSCLERWAPFMQSNAVGIQIAGSSSSQFPFVRVLGGVALIGLNSAVPTPPFVASGRLGKDQLGRLAKSLDACAGLGLTRLVLIHHPPLPGMSPPRRGLEDAAQLERVLEEHGAELVLHGHNHRDMLSWRQSRTGQVPILGVASGSAKRAHGNEPPARYNLVRLSERTAGRTIGVRVRGFDVISGKIVDIAHHSLDRRTQVAERG